MKPLTILFDADDTVENLCQCWVDEVNRRYGTHTTVEDVTNWNVSLAFPTLTREQVYSVLENNKLWTRLEPIPGCIEVLNRLRAEGHQLYMVTATHYNTCKTKIERLLEIFPFLDWNHIIITGRKQLVRGDILIDDAPHNLEGGDYFKILFDQPHNRNYDAKANDMLRVYSWKEIELAVHLYANFCT